MKSTRHTPEQIIRKLREAERLLASGKNVEEVCRSHEISVQTFQRWKARYQAMGPEEVAHLKALEKENPRLKKIVADQALDIDMLKEVARGNFEPRASPPRGSPLSAALRGLRAKCLPCPQPAPIHSASGETGRPFERASPPEAPRARPKKPSPGLPKAARDPSPGGLDGEPQTGAKDLAPGGPTGQAPKSSTSSGTAGPRSPLAHPPQPGVGDGLSVRRHHQRKEDQDPERNRRVHPGGARGQGCPASHRE